MARAKRQKQRGFNRKVETKISKQRANRVISIAALFCVGSALVKARG